MTLLDATLELAGTWRGSAPADASAVITRMRLACLNGVTLVSDRQPDNLRVDDHNDGPPAIWLHTAPPETAWIIVDVGALDWCNLAYQFGHELGHVLCNSWAWGAMPRNPCQWVEEALVEAFSLRGLGLLANAWAEAPPFAHDSAFAAAISDYRAALVDKYRLAARNEHIAGGFGAWFKARAPIFENQGGITAASGAVSTMLDLLESNTTLVQDMGALNRWPGRSGVPLPIYLDLWQNSCEELHAPSLLPRHLRQMLVGP